MHQQTQACLPLARVAGDLRNSFAPVFRLSMLIAHRNRCNTHAPLPGISHAWRSGQWESPTLRSCFVSSYTTSTRLVIAGLVFPVPGVTVVLCFLYIAAVNVVISAIARLHYSAVSREFSMCGGFDWIPIHILPPLENGQKHFFICATSFASPSHQYGSNASGFLNTSGFQCNV
ncbi:hypothetical protein B2J93_5888 [Marssonina coronariae]|uniref:Uncharacterized protein n=1 Tax=Diplocarpon coronariae TaxID=2795749 RepID=A0A218ZB74_9HELO|nr:hypothetical protein B2J93_5888 [Marssonina coronariae]